MQRQPPLSFSIAIAWCLVAAPAAAATVEVAGAPVYVVGIPVDFILFGLTLIGVAVSIIARSRSR